MSTPSSTGKKSKPAAPTSSVPSAVTTTAKTADPADMAMVKVSLKEVQDFYEGKGDLVAAKVPPLTVTELIEYLPETLDELGARGRGMILGVNVVRITRAFAFHVMAARVHGNPAPIVYAGVLAVAIAYTVSSEWVDAYDSMPGPHMFTEFEIEGRKEIVAAGKTKGAKWVTKSVMNAAALRIFGSMIVEAGQGNAFLAQLKTEAGSMFAPIEGTKERDLLMKEAFKGISVSDKEALAVFVANFKKYAEVVGALFGGTAGDAIVYANAAASMGEVYI